MTKDTDAGRVEKLRDRAESQFIRNQYGLWCPHCFERIDEMWPTECDACGYPEPDYFNDDIAGDEDAF